MNYDEDDILFDEVWKFISRPNKKLIAFSDYLDENDTFSLVDAQICLTPASFLFNIICNKYCYYYGTLQELGYYSTRPSIEDAILSTCDSTMLERFADFRVMLRLYGAFDDDEDNTPEIYKLG